MLSISLLFLFVAALAHPVYEVHKCFGMVKSEGFALYKGSHSCGMLEFWDSFECEDESVSNIPCCQNETVELNTSDFNPTLASKNEIKNIQLDLKQQINFIFRPSLGLTTKVRLPVKRGPPKVNIPIIYLNQRFLI